MACILLGGQAQAATIAMSFEIAAVHEAELTAIAPIDPFAPPARPTLSHSLWSLVEDIDLAAMHGSARSAVEQFDTHGCDDGLRISRVIGGSDAWALTAKAAESDLVLVPASVGMDGGWAEVWREVAEFMVHRRCVPILRVSRKPLDVRKVVLVVSSTERCSGMAHKYLVLGLWPQASVSILPIADYRSRVAENVREQLNLLQTRGLHAPSSRRSTSTSKERIWSRFSHRFRLLWWGISATGLAGSTLSDLTPFEIAASCVPLVLAP